MRKYATGDLLTRNRRIAGVLAGVAVGAGLIAWYLIAWVFSYPSSLQASTSGTTSTITLQTVASFGHQPHPDWVSYLAQDGTGQWRHTTIFNVPANSDVTVTIYNYDGASGLRNPLWSQPTGVQGGVETVDGKKMAVINPDDASHTFAIPDLGVSVALPGVADDAPNQCSVTPCRTSQAHRTITFTFHTGKPGHYRWQCFVPCAAGFPNGFGGPMQTVGWMDGYLNVS
jgi:hypothetical protein